MYPLSATTTGVIKPRDGINLSYTQEGPKDAANIVFMAGWRQTAAQWRKQASYFSKQYRVTTYDHRSHGESQKTAKSHRITSYASDFVNLLDQLNLQDVGSALYGLLCVLKLLGHLSRKPRSYQESSTGRPDSSYDPRSIWDRFRGH